MGGVGERQIDQTGHAIRLGVVEFFFAAVPLVEHVLGRQATDQPRVNQAGELHAGNMPRLGEHAVEVPDGFLRFREMLGEKAAAVLLGKEAVEAPLAFLEGADVEDIDHQQVAGLGAFHAHRAGQEMHLGEVHVAHVLGVVVVMDLAAGPVVAFNDEVVAGLHHRRHGNVGMPAVVHHIVVVGRSVEIDFNDGLSHGVGSSSFSGKRDSVGFNIGDRRTAHHSRKGPGDYVR